MLIAVSGNVGSGKTTIASRLATALGGRVADTRSYDQSYLSDQFNDPTRWSFETQMALLGAKASGIREAARITGTVIVDRSLSEDTEIFAPYFLSHGFLDERAFQTYVQYAQILEEAVPPVDVLVYCRCSPKTCSERVASRPRPYQLLYPDDFIDALHEAYEQWWRTRPEPLRVAVDSEEFDFRDVALGADIAAFVADVAAQAGAPSDQLSLFGDGRGPAEVGVRDYMPRIGSEEEIPRRRRRSRNEDASAPIAYLAAPFTAVASAVSRPSDDARPRLLDVDEPHGVLPEGPYRDALAAAASALEARGFRALLPHRDINAWGRRRMRPGQVANECLAGVRRADVVVAVLGTSFGVHAEVAAALGWGMPVVLVVVEEWDESFFATALRESGLFGIMTIRSISELSQAIASERFDDELQRAVRLRSSRARSLQGGPA